MPVVFDEVSASVEPEGSVLPAAGSGPAGAEEGDDAEGERDPRALGRALRRRAVRAARLRAD